MPQTVVIVGPFVLDQEKLLLLPFEISEDIIVFISRNQSVSAVASVYLEPGEANEKKPF